MTQLALQRKAPAHAGAFRTFQGKAQAFQASLSSKAALIAAALIIVCIILGTLYESFIHPLTIPSTSCGRCWRVAGAAWLKGGKRHTKARSGGAARRLGGIGSMRDRMQRPWSTTALRSVPAPKSGTFPISPDRPNRLFPLAG